MGEVGKGQVHTCGEIEYSIFETWWWEERDERKGTREGESEKGTHAVYMPATGSPHTPSLSLYHISFSRPRESLV
jgi:hypothetical protein